MESPVFRLVVMLCAALLLVGCGTRSDPSGTAAAPPGFPVTTENCGQRVTVDRPPTRAVGYYQQSVELMLALGLREHIVATVYPDNEPLTRYAGDYKSIPQLSAKDASFEQILALSPDFVYGGYSSAFDDAAGRSRKAFADASITTYLNPEFCATQPITMDDVYKEVATIAGFFGVPERAEEQVDEMRASVNVTADRVKGVASLKVFVYDSGTDTAFTAGRKGISNQIIQYAGGSNVFGDTDGTFVDVSWEQVLQREPDVVLILDYFGTPSVEEKKNFLRGRPDLANVPAIRDNRFAVLTLQDLVLGVRAPYAVAELAKQIHPERFR